jgi:hypothetical protein
MRSSMSVEISGPKPQNPKTPKPQELNNYKVKLIN